MTGLEIVLEYLPITIKNKIEELIILNKELKLQIEEIRLRNNKPLMLKIGQDMKIIDYMVKQQEILQAFERICQNSVYSYTKQICEGYITIKGGNRVGIVGSAVLEKGQVININYISSLNFRIASQKIGCSNSIIKFIIDEKKGFIHNTLIVSPPGCGKTTLLRDIVRNISNGMPDVGLRGRTVGVVDERGEIAAMYKGIPQNDIGIRTDVIDNMPKAEGMRILVRSMCPDVIVCDEIGNTADIEAINYAICSGVKGIFTAHGDNINQINQNTELSKLLSKHIIERIIFLNSEKRGDFKCVCL